MSRRRILFICGRGRQRSPTAADIYAGILDCRTDYAGLSKDADSPLTPEQIEWATEIAVMEPRHQATLRHEFGPHLRQKRVVCLNVPDRFRFMQPELVDLLTERAGRLR